MVCYRIEQRHPGQSEVVPHQAPSGLANTARHLHLPTVAKWIQINFENRIRTTKNTHNHGRARAEAGSGRAHCPRRLPRDAERPPPPRCQGAAGRPCPRLDDAPGWPVRFLVSLSALSSPPSITLRRLSFTFNTHGLPEGTCQHATVCTAAIPLPRFSELGQHYQ